MHRNAPSLLPPGGALRLTAALGQLLPLHLAEHGVPGAVCEPVACELPERREWYDSAAAWATRLTQR